MEFNLTAVSGRIKLDTVLANDLCTILPKFCVNLVFTVAK